MEKPLIVCIRDPTHVNSSCSTQVSDKVDEKLSAMLPGSHQHICTVGLFDLSLGVRVDDDDDRGDGLNADGTYTVRDKAHAHALMRDGNQGNKYIDPVKVIAAVGWWRENDPAGYNCGSVHSMCHKAEATIARDDQARSRVHFPLESFEGTHLVFIISSNFSRSRLIWKIRSANRPFYSAIGGSARRSL